MASPSWHEAGQYHGIPMERRTSATPLRSAFKMADLTSGDPMAMPYGNVDRQDQMPMEYLPGYDENVDQFYFPQDVPKTFDQTSFPYQAPIGQYHTMPRNHHYQYRPQQTTYLPESASNPCLSRPIFNQPPTERIPNSVSMTNMLQFMPPADSMAPQTITPSQAFGQPVTPLRLLIPNSLPIFTHSKLTHRLLLCGQTQSEHLREEFPMSPVYRDGVMRTHRQPSRKSSKKQLIRSNLSLENLPAVIKQVQFKCKEPGCKGRFKRQEHLKRHMKSHSKEKPHVCWVPGCHRAFSRSDNLNAHYTKTHSKRGGRNRYVATLDETSQDYDPDFRGQLTPDGRPIWGSKLEDAIPDCGDLDGWDD
ncbi:hypothetical protein N7450_006354 [Penicillium hetheringtonii]|uniref:C2H2 type master regulator of conidiophore development brlA n=1 Tax=Penicillium hetheringtonii TaxID=911720 RepID=A0AAD6GT73_9EURO|nr:hypothetical protein N7450_006354 [Penicillium hetheringtonii]